MSIDTSRPFPEISNMVIAISEVPGLLARARQEIADDPGDFPSAEHREGALVRLAYIGSAASLLADGMAEVAKLTGEEPTDPQVSLDVLAKMAADEHIEYLRVVDGMTGYYCDLAGYIAVAVLERHVLANMMSGVDQIK